MAIQVLGAIIPDLDDVIATERRSVPTAANPVLPLHLRPALLAGVAIVERSGPEMLKMLRAKMMGQNQAQFSSAIDEITTHTCRSMTSSQLQLIENPADRILIFKCQAWLKQPHSHF